MALTVPTIHLKGTSAVSLLEARVNAHVVLQEGLAALDQTAPNGRDYYLKPGSLTVAELQHRRRMQSIQEILRELEEEAEGIERQRQLGVDHV